MRFLTGWPFGFERIGRMADIVAGKVDPWVAAAGLERQVPGD